MSDTSVTPALTWMGHLKRVAPFLLIGPISGPLLAGVVFNLREGRPVLATLYGAALAEYVILLPTLTAGMTVHLTALLGHKLLF
jgi:hypothetical protein